MEKIKIIIDSASDITHELCDRYDIHVIPITIFYGGQSYLEHYEIDRREYWDVLEAYDEIPATAQITPVSFIEEFEKARSEGNTHVLIFLINAAGSGTYQSACTAKNIYLNEHGGDMRIEIVDSGLYTMAYGHVAAVAGSMREAGVSFEKILGEVKMLLAKSRGVAAAYTLKHMRKSGRIGGGPAFIGETLRMKPIMLLKPGGIEVMSKVRGEKAVLPAIKKYLEANADFSENGYFCVVRGKIPETEVDEMHAFIREKWGKDAETVDFGPSIVTNIGPQALAIVFYQR